MKIEKNSGITLVALVVTIIILIILATISIRMVIGEGGLINQANRGKVEYRAAEVDEEVLVWKAEKEMAKYAIGITPQKRDELIADQLTRGLLTQEEANTATETGEVQIGSRTIHYGEEEPPTETKNEIAQQYNIEQTEDKTVTDNSENPKSLTIPAGFTVVDPGEDNTVEYEDDDNPKIDEGIVVKDGAGNQFVWVPVDDINKIAMCQTHQKSSTIAYNEANEKFTCSGNDGGEVKLAGKLYDFEAGQKAYDPSKVKSYSENSDYREPALLIKRDTDDSLSLNLKTGLTSDNFETQLQNEFNSMIKSVAKYKGFYIGRYETSDLDKASPITQKDKTPTVSINWYTTYKNSKGVAKEGAKVTSSMIWGCQWDAVMNWFISCGGKTASYVTDSIGKGNYKLSEESGSKKNTGSNPAYAVNNIYDMAGNVYEWTLEAEAIKERSRYSWR